MSLLETYACYFDDCRVRLFSAGLVQPMLCPGCQRLGVTVCGNCACPLKPGEFHRYNGMGSCWIEKERVIDESR